MKTVRLALTVLCLALLCACAQPAPAAENVKKAPTDRAELAELLLAQIQEGMVYKDQDEVTFVNGTLFQLDIRTRETAEQLFACIRNCTSVFDYTDIALETMNLKIRMNGYQASFQKLFIRYKETGQLFGINFSEEDSKALYEYVMGLQ